MPASTMPRSVEIELPAEKRTIWPSKLKLEPIQNTGSELRPSNEPRFAIVGAKRTIKGKTGATTTASAANWTSRAGPKNVLLKR